TVRPVSLWRLRQDWAVGATFGTRPESPPPLKRDWQPGGTLSAFDRRRLRSVARSAIDEGQHAPTVLERIRACVWRRPSILRATDTPGRERKRADALLIATPGACP